MTEKKKDGLWDRTKDVATTYTGTFIVIMILNQLLFFGFCLNPICIIAAMPHVLLITVFVGSIINKIGGWGERGLAKKTMNTIGKKLDDIGETIGSASEETLESTIKLRDTQCKEHLQFTIDGLRKLQERQAKYKDEGNEIPETLKESIAEFKESIAELQTEIEHTQKESEGSKDGTPIPDQEFTEALSEIRIDENLDKEKQSKVERDKLIDKKIENVKAKLASRAKDRTKDVEFKDDERNARKILIKLNEYSKKGNDKEPFKSIKLSAEQGNAEAQNNLGKMYQFGIRVSQDYKEAIKWFRKAAKQGDADAQCNLGSICHEGVGYSQNYGEAFEWFKKSAEQGHSRSQWKLAAAYEFGQGVSQNDWEALKWYKKSVEQGNASAQFLLGLAYDGGQIVSQNDWEALKWYKKSAKQGDEYLATESNKRISHLIKKISHESNKPKNESTDLISTTKPDDPRLIKLPKENLPEAWAHGKPWTFTLDSELATDWESGMELLPILKKYGRTPRAIFARLCLLGELSEELNPYGMDSFKRK